LLAKFSAVVGRLLVHSLTDSGQAHINYQNKFHTSIYGARNFIIRAVHKYTHIMDFITLIRDVGFPIAGAIAAGAFVFITLKFILASVTGSVNTLKAIIGALDNRVQTMNNDLVKIDALLSYVLKIRPNADRIAANEGKDDARRD